MNAKPTSRVDRLEALIEELPRVEAARLRSLADNATSLRQVKAELYRRARLLEEVIEPGLRSMH